MFRRNNSKFQIPKVTSFSMLESFCVPKKSSFPNCLKSDHEILLINPQSLKSRVFKMVRFRFHFPVTMARSNLSDGSSTSISCRQSLTSSCSLFRSRFLQHKPMKYNLCLNKEGGILFERKLAHFNLLHQC